jgi:hypothetical protein
LPIDIREEYLHERQRCTPPIAVPENDERKLKQPSSGAHLREMELEWIVCAQANVKPSLEKIGKRVPFIS